MAEVINTFGIELAALLLGALAGLTLLDDLLADFASRIPLIGPILAPIMRRLSGRFRQWISERIPSVADRVVLEIEAELDGASGPAKLAAATERLRKAEPGLSVAEAQAAAQAAVDRAKAAPDLIGSSSSKPILNDHDERRMVELFELLLRDAEAAIENVEARDAARTDPAPAEPRPTED